MYAEVGPHTYWPEQITGSSALIPFKGALPLALSTKRPCKICPIRLCVLQTESHTQVHLHTCTSTHTFAQYHS